jgi:hypothetical protein
MTAATQQERARLVQAIARMTEERLALYSQASAYHDAARETRIAELSARLAQAYAQKRALR